MYPSGADFATASVPIPVPRPVSLDATFERIGRETYTSQYYARVPEHYGVPLGSVLGPDDTLGTAVQS